MLHINTMNSQTHKLSSLWSLVPFTKANKDVQFVLNKQRLNQEREEEQNRIQELEQIFSDCDGKHVYDPILKQLLLDAVSFDTQQEEEEDPFSKKDVSSPDILQVRMHFQKLKYLEEQSQIKHDISSPRSDPNPPPHQQALVDKDDPLSFIQDAHLCTWVGNSEKGEPLHCVNYAILHPWKQYMSHSTGISSPLSTGFCIFHQKYCLDTSKLHVGGDIRMMKRSLLYRNRDYQLYPISLPNRDGLCKECFVLKNGKQPPHMMSVKHLNMTFCHVPGVRKKKIM